MLVYICLLNIEGLVGRPYNKINDLELKSIFNYHDIVMLTESWLNDSSECSVDDFTYYRLNRTLNHKNTRRNSGGIIVYVSNKISQNVTLLKTEGDCILWLNIDSCLFSVDNDLFLCLC